MKPIFVEKSNLTVFGYGYNRNRFLADIWLRRGKHCCRRDFAVYSKMISRVHELKGTKKPARIGQVLKKMHIFVFPYVLLSFFIRIFAADSHKGERSVFDLSQIGC